MVEPPQHSTVDLLQMRLRLRTDLVITPQRFGGELNYVIEDPLAGKYFRLGSLEYGLVSLMDGTQSIADVISKTSSTVHADAIDEREAVRICQWLVDNQLASTPASQRGRRAARSKQEQTQKRWKSYASPLFQKIPLGSPAKFIKRFDGVGRWLFSIPGVLLAAVLMIVAARCLLSDGSGFLSATPNVLSQDNWGYLLGTLAGLKLIHEMGHALACQRFGCHVRQCGVVLVLFAPLPYVDVTSSWRLTSKWKRIAIAAAGMYFEVMVASLAMLVWSTTSDPWTQQLTQNIILSATVITLLFNLNPLMRFDGYYMLVDALELPNLATRGAQWFASFRRRWLLGVASQTDSSHAEDTRRWASHFIKVYALAASMWRVLIFVSLSMAAMHLLWGAGVVLALTAMVFFVGRPLMGLIRSWGNPASINRPYVFKLTVSAAVVLGIASLVPYQQNVTSPVVIDYDGSLEIRSRSRGKIVEVLAAPGDTVAAGDPIVRLENHSLAADIARMEIEVQQSQLKQREYRQVSAIAALQVESENENALRLQLQQLIEQRDHLVIYAPTSGRLISSGLVDKQGTFVDVGELLLELNPTSVDSPARLVAKAMVNQRDAVRLSKLESIDAELWIWGSGPIESALKFTKLHPRATTRLPHPAFGAHCGGPLAVREGPHSEIPSDRYELIEPHVLAEAELPPTERKRVREGQSGRITFTLRSQSLWELSTDKLQEWWNRRTSDTRRYAKNH